VFCLGQVFREKYRKAKRRLFFEETARLELEQSKTRITFTEEKRNKPD